MKPRSIIKIIWAIIVFAAMIYALYQVGPGECLGGKEIEHTMESLPAFVTYDVDEQNHMSQNFIPDYGYIKNLKMIMLQVGDEYTGNLVVQITDEEGNTLFKQIKAVNEMNPGEWVTLSVDAKVPMKKLCTLNVYAEQTEQPVKLMVSNAAFDIEENQSCFYQGQEIADGLLEIFDYQTTYTWRGKAIISMMIILIGLCLLGMLLKEDFAQKMYNLCYQNQDMRQGLYYVLLCVLAVFMAYVHYYQLSAVPYGVNIDEMGMGYDAWSIANFGVDRYLKSYPAYLVNFAGGQSALYMYLTAIFIKLFGYSESILRIPAVLNAIVIVFFGAKLIKLRWKKRSVTILYTALFTVFPIFIMFTRVGLDCNLMLGVTTIFLYLICLAIQKQQKRYFVLAGIVAGIALYTYVISYLMMPLFILALGIYCIYVKKINWKQIISFIIPLGVLAMPLLLVQITNIFDLPEWKLGFMTITKLPVYRGGEITFDHYFQNLYETLVCIFWNDMWNYDSLPDYHTMYWFTIPFLIVGICDAVSKMRDGLRKKEWSITTIILLWLGSVILVGGLLGGGSGPTCYKVNASYFACLYLCIEGMVCLYQLLHKEVWLKACCGLLIAAYVISFTSFTEYYYNQYVDDVYPNVFFNTTYADTIQAYQDLDDSIQEREVYVERNYTDDLIYFCCSLLQSPYQFQYGDIRNHYEQFTFKKYSELEIDTSKVYMLEEGSRDFAIELEKNGFSVSLVGTRFLCYQQ